MMIARLYWYNTKKRRFQESPVFVLYQKKYFFLFSAKGFSEEIRQLAEEDTRYILVDMNEL